MVMQLLVQRLGRSRGAIRRIAAEARAARLRACRPIWMHLPVFENPEAERILLEAPQVESGPAPAHPESIPAILDRAGVDSEILEPLLLPAMHLQRCVVARLIDALPRTPSITRLDVIETGLRRADVLRLRVGQAVLGASLLRVQHAEGLALEKLEASEQRDRLGFCIDVVDQMLDEFDPRARGELEPRLDRRVALETDKQIALRQRRGQSIFETGASSAVPQVSGLLGRLEPMRRILGLSPHLIERLDRLASPDQDLLEARYGLGAIRPQTLEELAVGAGESTRRISTRLCDSQHALRVTG